MNNYLSTGSSRGNQKKWTDGKFWYKIDQFCYEGLSESIVSDLLCCSNEESFVEYRTVDFNGNRGCVSHNFKPDSCEIVTISRLIKGFYGVPVSKFIDGMDLVNSIKFLVKELNNITGISEQCIGAYFTKNAELDALVLNDDRHFNNLGFLYDGSDFALLPIFDNGAAFLSDTTYYYDDCMIKNISKAKSKPFCQNFKEQKIVLEGLYGKQLLFDLSKFSIRDSIYPKECIDRILTILKYQVKTFPDLIKNKMSTLDFF